MSFFLSYCERWFFFLHIRHLSEHLNITCVSYVVFVFVVSSRWYSLPLSFTPVNTCCTLIVKYIPFSLITTHSFFTWWKWNLTWIFLFVFMVLPGKNILIVFVLPASVSFWLKRLHQRYYWFLTRNPYS